MTLWTIHVLRGKCHTTLSLALCLMTNTLALAKLVVSLPTLLRIRTCQSRMTTMDTAIHGLPATLSTFTDV